MKMNRNPYQIICKGVDCLFYDDCENECILKSSNQKKIKGCNYSNSNTCKYCSHKNKCVLIKPYSEKLFELEIKRVRLENENRGLYKSISLWDSIEKNLDNYGDFVNSVTDVVYFDMNKQQMINKIFNNEKLIKAYSNKENELIKQFG